jgi:NAD(P)-dependent dehydrogenase (short-subunit alcohol dehydrogenase family)
LEVPDYLVNCAGNEPFGSLDDFDETKWRQAFDLKLWGYVKLSHGVFELMRQAHREGCIINVAGSGGAFPQAWYPAGAMINAAVSAFTVAFAHQAAAFGVRVNAVSPHYIATERLEGGFADPTAPGVPTLREMRASVGMRRMGRTTEVADAVLYLLSPGAAFVSGAVLPVDGATVGLLAANDYDWNAAKGGHDARADR